MRWVWLAFRRTGVGRRAVPLAGPLALIAVVAVWAAMMTLGWALVYLPHLDDGAVGALHFSLASLTTLGADLSPDAGWLRVAAPFEALLGFGLLSASISWLLLIYPVLTRRRTLAYEVSLLRKVEQETGVSPVDLEPETADRLYADLVSRLVAVERDLVNFPVSYYFAESDERFSLPASGLYLLALARHGTSDDKPEHVRLRARMLLDALEDLGATVSGRFGRHAYETADEALTAYAKDHRRAAE